MAQPQCQDQNRDQPHKKGAKFKYLPLRDIDDICLFNILVTFAEPVILIEDSWIKPARWCKAQVTEALGKASKNGMFTERREKKDQKSFCPLCSTAYAFQTVHWNKVPWTHRKIMQNRIKKWKSPNVHTHTEASRQAHSPSYSKIMVDAFPQAGSEWLLFNYSSGTTGEKAVPTILFFFIWNYMWEMPLGSMLKINVSVLKYIFFFLGCCVYLFSDHSEMRLFRWPSQGLTLLLVFACSERQYCDKTGSRNEHNLLFTVRIFCISLRSGSTFEALQSTSGFTD